MEWNVTEGYKKKEREWNDLAEGPCSKRNGTISKKSDRPQPYTDFSDFYFFTVYPYDLNIY